MSTKPKPPKEVWVKVYASGGVAAFAYDPVATDGVSADDMYRYVLDVIPKHECQWFHKPSGKCVDCGKPEATPKRKKTFKQRIKAAIQAMEAMPESQRVDVGGDGWTQDTRPKRKKRRATRT